MTANANAIEDVAGATAGVAGVGQQTHGSVGQSAGMTGEHTIGTSQTETTTDVNTTERLNATNDRSFAYDSKVIGELNAQLMADSAKLSNLHVRAAEDLHHERMQTRIRLGAAIDSAIGVGVTNLVDSQKRIQSQDTRAAEIAIDREWNLNETDLIAWQTLKALASRETLDVASLVDLVKAMKGA